MQLDIFEHSRDVMLRNDVLQSLAQYAAAQARARCETLAHDYPQDPALAALGLLIGAVAARFDARGQLPAFADHGTLAQAQLVLRERLTPVAQSLMAVKPAQIWLRTFWQDLIARSAHLPYSADTQAQHVAPMLLHIEDWQGAADAVTHIESWRRIPAPLAWMAQARLNLLGLHASWPLLAELAWLSPQRLEALVQTSADPILKRLKNQFEAEFDASNDVTDGASGPCDDLAWFPAWLLTQRTQLASHLAQAQPGMHGAPEQAMRLLVNLLGLEHQGRHQDIVSHRKTLRDLHGGLYAAYMKTR